MKLFSHIAAALTGLAVLGTSASPALATEQRWNNEGSLEAHGILVQQLRDAGLDVQVNHGHCDSDPGMMGFYAGQERLLVVCQDNAPSGSREAVDWTANDLDTLRHEAQHFIQDCMLGSNHDHQLGNVYKDPAQLVLNVLGMEGARGIARAYMSRGHSERTVMLEWEAFSVAALNVPLEQAQDIRTYCMGPHYARSAS